MKIIIQTRIKSLIHSCLTNSMRINRSFKMTTLPLYLLKTVFLKKKTFNISDKEIEEIKTKKRIIKGIEMILEIKTPETKIEEMIGKGDEKI